MVELSCNGFAQATTAFMCDARNWTSQLGCDHLEIFLVNGLFVHTKVINLKAPRPQVEERRWGTRWRISDDVITWKVSTTLAPQIPSWHRYTECKEYIICLR